MKSGAFECVIRERMTQITRQMLRKAIIGCRALFCINLKEVFVFSSIGVTLRMLF